MAEAGIQCHSESYPISVSDRKTSSNPRERRALTFSITAYFGLVSLMILCNSNHSPLLSPDNPAPFPARLMSWHGKPPQITSGRIPSVESLSAVRVRTSSYCGTSGQCFLSTARQNGSISQKATVCIPARSSPRLNPPMPLNKSKTFNQATIRLRRTPNISRQCFICFSGVSSPREPQ